MKKKFILILVFLLLSSFGEAFGQEQKHHSEFSISAGTSFFGKHRYFRTAKSLIPEEFQYVFANVAQNYSIQGKHYLTSSFYTSADLSYDLSVNHYEPWFLSDAGGKYVLGAAEEAFSLTTGLGYNYSFWKLHSYIEACVGFSYLRINMMIPEPLLNNYTGKFVQDSEYIRKKHTPNIGLRLGLDYSFAKHWKIGLQAQSQYFLFAYARPSLHLKLTYVDF